MIEKKICNNCNLEKEFSLFSPLKTGKHGFNSTCKECRAYLYKKQRLENPEKFRKNERERYAKNPIIKKLSIKKWYEKNSENKKEKEKIRYLENKEKIKEITSAYRLKNKDKIRCSNVARKSFIKLATPKWANYEIIKKIYKKSEELSIETGVLYHVDHIIPLRNKFVSGLHVENNLQIITSKENLKKSNSFVFI